jgi:hypothetical protein
MYVKEPNDLVTVANTLTIVDKPSHRDDLRDESLIYFLALLSAPVSRAIKVIDKHPIHVLPKERSPIVSENHSVWIDHGNDLENILGPQTFCY